MLSDAELRRLYQRMPSPLREATIQDPPLTDEGFLRVELDGAPGGLHECPWPRVPGEPEPVGDDAAAVVESDEGNFWVVAWWRNGEFPSVGPAAGGHTIEENGAGLPQRASVNFAAGLLASDDAANGRTNIAAEVTGADLTGHTNRTDNPHAVSKGQVGLANVNNTADVDKPVSTAQAAAINTAIANFWASLPEVDIDRYPLIVPEADDAPRINRAIAALPARGGTIKLRSADYVCTSVTITIPENKPVRIVGTAMSMVGAGAGVGGASGGTRLIRTANKAFAMVTANGSAFGNRVFMALEDLSLTGQGTTGMGLDTGRLKNSYFHRVRISGFVDTGWRIRQAFNCSADNVWIESCGNGLGSPALLLDAYDENQGGSATMHFNNLELEGNSGTDLAITGKTTASGAANNAPTNDIQFTNVKMEGGTAAANGCPFVSMPYAQNVRFNGLYISLHSGRNVPPIQIGSLGGSGAANVFTSLTIENGQGGVTPQYYVLVERGVLIVSGLCLVGAPSLAAVRIADTMGDGTVAVDNVVTNFSNVALFSDARAGRVPYALFSDSLNSRGRASRSAAWLVPNAAWTRIPFDNVELDSEGIWDAANTRFKVKRRGPYRLQAAASFAPSGAGALRQIAILVNGKPEAVSSGGGPSNQGAVSMRVNCAADVELVANDTVEVVAYQDTGNTLNLTITLDTGGGARNLNTLSVTRTP